MLDTELALTLASSLQPLWLTRGRIQEGLNWLGAALADDGYRDARCRRRRGCGRPRTTSLLLSFSAEPTIPTKPSGSLAWRGNSAIPHSWRAR